MIGKPIAIHILVLFIVLPLCAPLVYAQEEPSKRVLVLNSYHKGFLWTDNIVKGIESVLGPEENEIELKIEYMDSKSTKYDTQYKEKLYELYNYKYSNQTFDLIICSDDNAFDFLLDYHEDMFPGTPVVFCGVNNPEAPDLVDPSVFTGIQEWANETEDTLSQAFKFHPETKKVIILSDTTPTGIQSFKNIERQIKKFSDIEFIRFDSSMSMYEIEDNLSKLDEDTIILYETFFRDSTGRYFSIPQGVSAVTSSSNRPVYTMRLQYLPYNVVGGKMMPGVLQGEAAAEIALCILDGEKVENIPIVEISPTQYMFNYEQLKRFGIKLSDLPEDSIVINKPYSFYEENKGLIWGIIAFSIFQTLIIICLFVNMSRRKRAEGDLKRTVTDLERSNTELEQFAHIASHDLQEPLRTVSSYMELMKRRYEGKLDSDADDFIGFAVDGANRMQTLITDLLAFSRVGTRGEPLTPTDCETLLSQTLSDLKVSIEDSGAVITHDALPTVMADGSQLAQVFQNLISNAIKFKGKEQPRIHIAAERKDSEWVFSVADNGIGIEQEFFDRIFVIFKRLHGRDEYSGTGIGLAVCKKIVERHGGRMWVESEIGQGSTFYFTIPSKATGEQL